MTLSGSEIKNLFDQWIISWGRYDLEGIMALMHNDVIFENWDGSVIKGKNLLRKAWTLWFTEKKNFRFITEDIFIDEKEQKLLFRWHLEWPSREPAFKGKLEVRKGVDVIHFYEAKIILKMTYTQTMIRINGKPVILHATE